MRSPFSSVRTIAAKRACSKRSAYVSLALSVAKKRLEQEDTSRFRVVGLTFTNKAAAEMRERVSGILQTGGERALLTTFHAFAADILRQHGSHIGLSPDFSILNSEEDRMEIFEDAVRSASLVSEQVSESDVSLLPLLTNLIEKRVDELQYWSARQFCASENHKKLA